MKVRIVSRGHGLDTHVFAVSDDGELHPIRGVQAVEFSIPGPRERATAKLTVLADANVVGEVEEPVPHGDRDPFEYEDYVKPRDPTMVEEGMGLEPEAGISLRVALYVIIPAVASTIGYVIAKL